MSPKNALLLSLLLLLVPAGAGAYTTDGEGSRDGREITYFNAVSAHDWAVKRAVRAWNRSGAQVRFVPASRGEAELVVTGGESGLDGHTETVTRSSGPRPGDAQVRLPNPGVGGRDGRFTVALIAAHELGHALKLDHEDSGCATMNSTIVNGAPARCPQPPADEWRCGLLEEDDIRGAVALYGGAPLPPKRTFCPKVPPKPKPPPSLPPEPDSDGSQGLGSIGAIEVTSDPARSRRVTVRWLNGESGRVRSNVVARAPGRCPRRPSEGEAKTVPAEPSAEGRVTFPLRIARTCYAVWPRDRSGELSRRPATAWLDSPARPSAPAGFSAEPTLSMPLGDTGVTLRWRNEDGGTLESVLIARAKGRWPPRPPRRSPPWHAPAALARSYQEHADLGFYPASDAGRYCYAAWSRDRFGRLSRRVTAWPERQTANDGVIVLAD
jgi:hypothetical protein